MSLTVFGDPQPKGSKTAFVVRRKNAPPGAKGAQQYRAIVTDVSNKSSVDRYGDWKSSVELAALRAMNAVDVMPFNGPLAIVATFYMRRPKNETRVQRLRIWHCVKPDADKLLRAVLDPLSRIVISDDARISSALIQKRYVPYLEASLPRACITITNLSETD